jgi:molybdopterin/thiamine biosynthesis adenylyltransferase
MNKFGGRADLNHPHENLPGKSFLPEMLYLSKAGDRDRYNQLLKTAGVEVFDTLMIQLQELIKIKHPSIKLSAQQIVEKIDEHLKGVLPKEYGVWCFYPWSGRMVHLPDREEFIALRTSRNIYKITPQERDLLGEKKIGVIGLSVGQSVSLTLAMERICGELRLADFDKLELTNLNRIRTGVHNLGLEKVYAVAREIAEIDPFIKIKCFEQGVTEENIDSFFNDGGKLDLLVEESDGFDIKILSRLKARSLGIPVIMEASDRCMVDVERFDLEPERPILHGLVKHLDVAKLKTLKTNEEKIPYMLDILGIDTCSDRLKASMIEIDQSIGTWPQLASSVAMGGGITADVCRRMLLNQYTGSGRYHVDIEKIIGDPEENKSTNKKPLSNQKNEEHNFKFGSLQPISACIALEEKQIRAMVEDAIKAPSAGNNQPWYWHLKNNTLGLYHDKKRSAGWTDPDDHLAMMALGAALENLHLSAMAKGYESVIEFSPAIEAGEPIAQIGFKALLKPAEKTELNLYQTIGKRCSNRKKGKGETISAATLQEIQSILPDGYQLTTTSQTDSIAQLAEIISEIEKIRFMHPEGHAEFFKKELRWTAEEIAETKDGIDIATLELSFLEQTGIKISSEEKVISLVREWGGGGGLKKITREAVLSSAAIGLIYAKEKNQFNFLNAGRAVQRAWLQANHLQLSVHPVSSPLFFFDRIKRHRDLDSETVEKIVRLEEKFKLIFPVPMEGTPYFLFRLSLAEAPSAYSLRIPVDNCFSNSMGHDQV